MEAIQLGGNSAKALKEFADRVIKLTDERQHITDDINSVFADAKAEGFNKKALREVIKLKRMDPDQREEAEYFREAYKEALDLV